MSDFNPNCEKFMTDSLLTTLFIPCIFKQEQKWFLLRVTICPCNMPWVSKEHLHCRAQAGLFDVSHMGQVRLTGTSMESIALALESLIPADYVALAPGRQRYGFTNASGGIMDDLMVTNAGDHFF